ncbi:MAG: type I-B CRISPR-associated endonuclease Cas1b [Candidatus Muiribacteriota bacterium]
MKETIYIFTSGRLKRKDNTLFFQNEEGNKKFIPVENVKEILVFGEIDVNKKVLEFLSQKEIMLSYFNYYGHYMGTFYPREHYNSGFMILRQCEYYSEHNKRLFLAKQFVDGAAANSLKILRYYNRRDKAMTEEIAEMENLKYVSLKSLSVEKLMAFEGQIKQLYYRCFNKIINNEDFKFNARTRRPPKDYINALISFANSLIYNFCLKEIYHTHLDPRIGYLHTTNFRRFTLNLDVAEIFKPIIGDRTIFSCLNKNILSENDFSSELNGIMMNEKGKKKFLEQLEEHLKKTIKHKKLNRHVSYRRLIRMELYKLEKHLMEEEDYNPFVMEW